MFCTDMGVNTDVIPVLTRPPIEDPEQKYEFTLGEMKQYEKELKRVVDNAIDDFMKSMKKKQIKREELEAKMEEEKSRVV